LVWTLITISLIDFEHYLIPDRLSLPLLWLGLLLNATDSGFVSLSEAVWGAAAGYVCLWLIFQIHRAITGKEGMGYGDFKLTAALGAWLGVQALIPIFILAGGLAIVVMGSFMLFKKHELANAFPFGPWLAGAGMVVLLMDLL
jgi:leader peptidase (prepilin peptidase)/N-methyltransferase